MPRTMRFSLRLLPCCLLFSMAGCATLNIPLLEKQPPKASLRDPATQIVCLWEPAEGRDPKGVPCRGFAGKVIFMARSGAVAVDGDIRIYLFDNHGTIEDQAKPVHQFDFVNKSWDQNFTYGPVGPSYSVFIPYLGKGSDPMCSLRVRLTPKKGPVIFSDMTSIGLNGFGSKKEGPKPSTDPRVEPTSPLDLTANSKLRKTTTITLKPGEDPASVLPDLLPAGNTNDTVQQASYQTESKPGSGNDDRIAQLEQMVRELRSQLVNPAPARSVESTPARQVQSQRQMPPQREVQPVQPVQSTMRADDREVMRFRVKPASNVVAEPGESPSREEAPRFTLRQFDDEPPRSSRRRHPLDEDDAPEASVRKSRVRQHPLSDEPETSAAREVRTASRRHPLDDDEPVAQPSSRAKFIPASIPARDVERDPFEPIDVDEESDDDVGRVPFHG